jgi:hypothetical protein
MGVCSLLPLLEYAVEQINQRTELLGKIVDVDASFWLHELVTRHCYEVVVRKSYDRVVQEFVWRAQQYLARGTKLKLVFDGIRPAAKYATNEKRTEKRVMAMAVVEGVMNENEEDIVIDPKLLKVAAHVSHVLVNLVIAACRTNGIPYKMAPTEADAQLVFDQLEGRNELIISGDSDLVFIGGTCVALKIPGQSCTSPWLRVYKIERIMNPVIPQGVTQENPLYNKIDYSLALEIKRLGKPALLIYGLIVPYDYHRFPKIGRARGIRILNSVELRPDGVYSDDLILKQVEIHYKKELTTAQKTAFRLAHFRLFNQLVYDSNSELIVPMSNNNKLLGNPGDDRLGYGEFDKIFREHVREQRADDGDMLVPGVTIMMTPAERRQCCTEFAAGHWDYTTRKRLENMVAIERVHLPLRSVPIRLTAAMIPGATLPKSVEKSTVEALRTFVHTRGQTIPTGTLRPGVVSIVNDLLATEAMSGSVRLYDVTGKSLMNHLVDRGEIPDFVADPSTTVTYPVMSDSRWLPLSEIADIAPILTDNVLRTHFASLGALQNSYIRVLETGFSLIHGLANIDLKFHPGEFYTVGNTDPYIVQYFKMKCPSTFHINRSYPCQFAAQVMRKQAGEIPEIMNVLCFQCGGEDEEDTEPINWAADEVAGSLREEEVNIDDAEVEEEEGNGISGNAVVAPPVKKKKKKDDGKKGCKARKSGCGCVHISALLQVIQNLPRRESKYKCPTSDRCVWNRPSSGEFDDDEPGPGKVDTKTADSLRIMKGVRMMIRKEGENRIMLCPEKSRALWDPLSKEDAATLSNRFSEARVAAREKLDTVLRKSLEGRQCAGHELWYNNKK